jgi:hypothetical protein
MITGEGGFISRMMPPTDWNHGPIPVECFDKSLSKQQIFEMLKSVYLEPDRVRKLAASDDETEIWRTKFAIEIVAEMDADTIWFFNLQNEKESG